MSNIKPVKIKGRIIKPPKAIVQPLLDSQTVLTDTPWDFVDLWLRKKKGGVLYVVKRENSR